MRTALFGLLTALAWGAASAASGDCARLSTLTLPHTRITLAEIVPAGAFAPAKPFSLAGPAQQPSYQGLPAFCRVAVQVSPVPGSLIRFELWLPDRGWNGKFLAVGNGGYSGEIFYPEMIEPLARGYATASTDTGHEGSVGDASFALRHPEKWIDFAYRAVHQMTVQSKAIIESYYGDAAGHSYWSGCSTGGRQGLTEAQRFPADFDGIIAGAPANYMTHLSAAGTAEAQAMHRSAGSFLPPDKLLLLHAAVLKACDALDGVTDGVIEDPRRCHFDPGALGCTAADNAACLTAAQVETARRIYGPLRNPRTHAILFPGLMPGSESAWSAGVGPGLSLVTGIFRDVAFQDPNWDYRTLNFDRDMVRADRSEAALANNIDPHLGAFFARGGKLIQYHGWADQGISPLNSIDYYLSAARAAGGVSGLADEYRLFMVPGMNHCSGGDGPDHFDTVTALEQWVEHGKAPNRIVASRTRGGRVDRTRPLCPYPEVAVYKGSGSTDEASSFACGRTR
ncbi:MAG: tannase/feruloyl esterase family alpha/beta hydrolase [Steroidobacteraceae bacterium]